jgi:hypothetical protein
MSRKREPEDPDELLARSKANGYRRGEHREQDAVLNRHPHVDKTIYDQDGALRRYVVSEGPSLLVYKRAPVLTRSSRWKLDEMREDAKRRGVTPPDERTAREYCLNRGVEAPGLAGTSPSTALQSGSLAGSPE